jgi:hypothetical protein
VLFVVTLVALYGLSFLVGRWEAPREVGPTPPRAVIAVAAVLAFIPPFLVLQFFMDLPLAIIGSVLLTVSVLLLGRWGSRLSTRSASGLASSPD